MPSSIPRRFEILPAVIFLTITSTGIISTSLTAISLSLSSSTKWVFTPLPSKYLNIAEDILLLMTPLFSIVPFFSALKAVASSLKYIMLTPTVSVENITFALPSYN